MNIFENILEINRGKCPIGGVFDKCRVICVCDKYSYFHEANRENS